MLNRITHVCIVALLVRGATSFVMNVAYADSHRPQNQVVASLPSDIALMLRERNHGSRGGCSESYIFIHGFHYLGSRTDKAMWFLGAPDYLCETNSFISVIATPYGEWTIGHASDEDWLGGRMLAGVPVLFQQSSQLGYFVISEWQVEGPMNFMYHSTHGNTWVSVDLPAAECKNQDCDCSNVAAIRELCIDDSGSVLVSYLESEQFRGSVWSSKVDESFPEGVDWARVSVMPDSAQCDGVWPGNFIPGSLREKTSEGALFELSLDWAVHIPGPTR